MAVGDVFAQKQKIADSLALVYQRSNLADSARLEMLRQLAFNEVHDLKKGLHYADELIRLATTTGNTRYLRMGYFLKGTKLRLLGSVDEALAAFFQSAAIARNEENQTAEGETYSAIADSYSVANHHANAREYYDKAIASLRKTNDSLSLASAIYNAGDELYKIQHYDTALLYFIEALHIFEKKNYQSGKAYCLGSMGMVYASLGKNSMAVNHIQQAIGLLQESQDYYPMCDFLFSMADVYWSKGDTATAMAYTRQSLHLADQYGLTEQLRDANKKLSELYEHTGHATEALAAYKTYIAYRDSINNLAAERKMADLRYNFGMSQKQAEVDVLNVQKRNEKKLSVMLAIILGLTVMVLGILFWNYKTKQRAYQTLNRQKQETEAQKAKTETALSELQRTQKQLIQSAKMASLGELTAGIAHEIQNPLNFVNNFSEVSVELLHELREGVTSQFTASGKAEASQILTDLADNLQKIHDHGKRADSIVKGMLQHSRAGTGKKELADINALADEYLRLSYHGLRAQDASFLAGLKTDFDDSITRIEMVPQDIGRVLLNIYNNAFFAVREKKKQRPDFEPLVSVSTKRMEHHITIKIKDNGTGIPQALVDKIFQPFFTTKPAGQGTGLGLSLSYDIIKAHGGELNVATKDGEFTEFVIELPITVKQVEATVSITH